MSTTENICGLNRADFQTTINGKETDLFILKNNNSNEVAISNYGGTILSIMVPDKDGQRANVVQGYKNIQEIINSPEPYQSALIGRYGNRIANGKFLLHGKEYNLPINDAPNSLHGGKSGWNTKVWEALQMNEQTLVLKYISPYGEEGYTGEVKVTVVYTFNNDDELVIDYMATTNKKTVINLTNHAYFTLQGNKDNAENAIENQICEINANYYLPVNDVNIPTGEIRFVDGTPFDFRTPKAIGTDINADNEQLNNCKGYDHCYVLNKQEVRELSFAARLTDPESGRTMDVLTTEPGMQFYTDNRNGGYSADRGAAFPRRSAVCFECQHFPDSPNHPYFPSVVLNPGEQYKQKTIYKFGVEK